MTGAPSLTLLTRDAGAEARFVAVADRSKGSDCLHWAALLFMWGNLAPTHEGIVDRLLEEHQADVLLDAEITTSQFGLPYLYFQICTNVEGVPARRVGGGAKR